MVKSSVPRCAERSLCMHAYIQRYIQVHRRVHIYQMVSVKMSCTPPVHTHTSIATHNYMGMYIIQQHACCVCACEKDEWASHAYCNLNKCFRESCRYLESLTYLAITTATKPSGLKRPPSHTDGGILVSCKCMKFIIYIYIYIYIYNVRTHAK
jgi:hypothetical protein